MLQGASPQLAPDSVREALASVFSHAAYHRPLRRSVWQFIVSWWNDIVRAFFGALRDVGWIKWAVIGAMLVLALTAAARILVVRRTRGGARLERSSDSAARHDAWTLARGHAAGGRYLDAAHALYLAILESVATSDRLTLDPAKTVGDYSRELRATSSAALPVFREFAVAYEPIVWGSRDCDRDCYETLAAIAGRAVR